MNFQNIFSKKKKTPANLNEETRSSVIKFNWEKSCGKAQRKTYTHTKKKKEKKTGVIIRWVLVWLETGKSITALGCLYTFLPMPSRPKLFLKIPIWSLCNHYTILCLIIITHQFLENSEYFVPVRSKCNGRYYPESMKKHILPRKYFPSTSANQLFRRLYRGSFTALKSAVHHLHPRT